MVVTVVSMGILAPIAGAAGGFYSATVTVPYGGGIGDTLRGAVIGGIAGGVAAGLGYALTLEPLPSVRHTYMWCSSAWQSLR